MKPGIVNTLSVRMINPKRIIINSLLLTISSSFNSFTLQAQYSRDPAWSADGSEIVYVSQVNDHTQVFIMNKDGSDKKQVTNKEVSHYYPFLSPDGDKIVYMEYSDETVICTINRDGTDHKCLTDKESENADPHWSPDGSKIIFYSNRDGNNEIYIMDSDGSNPTRITDHPASDQTPSISPDGKRIVFVSDRDGNPEVYVMDTDGENVIRLTFDPRSDRVPSWGPNGKKVIWYSREPSKVTGSGAISWKGAEIYSINVDGTERKQLTHNHEMDHGPVYSPDGKYILFTSGRTGNREIFIMDANGENVRQLTP